MKKYLPVLILIFAAAFARMVPHYPNVTPLAAMGLMGAAYFRQRWLAFLVPFIALFLSDLVLNNTVYAPYYNGFKFITSGWIYLAFAAVIGIGMLSLRQIQSPQRIALASVLASVAFFLISNLYSWQTLPMYTKDFSGLMAAYTNALPFLGYSILGDLFYSAVLFGGLALWTKKEYSLA